MKPGDIMLGRFPFGGTLGAKLRPVLLLTDPVGSVSEVLTAYISSVVPSPLLPSDLLLNAGEPAFKSTGLKLTSVVRLHKLATLHRRDLARRLGKLAPPHFPQVDARLRALLYL